MPSYCQPIHQHPGRPPDQLLSWDSGATEHQGQDTCHTSIGVPNAFEWATASVTRGSSPHAPELSVQACSAPARLGMLGHRDWTLYPGRPPDQLLNRGAGTFERHAHGTLQWEPLPTIHQSVRGTPSVFEWSTAAIRGPPPRTPLLSVHACSTPARLATLGHRDGTHYPGRPPDADELWSQADHTIGGASCTLVSTSMLPAMCTQRPCTSPTVSSPATT